jgi:conjugative relaxase-like TrwC/TraI family protein
MRFLVHFSPSNVSAPKSVSIAAVTFGDERLRLAHREAVKIAFSEMERLAARRVRGAEAVNSRDMKMTGNLTAAAFEHDASRELDAQLHTHLVTANATRDPQTGEWYALENSEIFANIELCGRIYQNELARRTRELGYGIVEDRDERGVLRGFELAGVTQADRLAQSTRRLQIEAEIARFVAEKGRQPTAGERHVMATETRDKKLAEITTDEVRAGQLAKYDAASVARLRGLVDAARERAAGSVEMRPEKGAIAFAVEHLFERKSVIEEKELLVTALQENLGHVDISRLRAGLESSLDVVKISDGGATLYTTRENLERERECVGMVNAAKNRFAPLAPGAELPASLSPDQRGALDTLVACTDGVMAMRGPAGAGKTFTMTALDKACRANGVETVFIAPTHKAKEILQADGFTAAETVSNFLIQAQGGRMPLAGKLVVVDESGMMSTRQGHALLQAVTKAGARVLLVGDEKQLSSVEAGEFLGMLKKHSSLTMPELTAIRRQKHEDYRLAMMSMSEGRVADGMAALDKLGWIKEAGGNYLNAAADAYEKRIAEGKSAILVAPTWAEIGAMTSQLRERRAARGELKGDELAFKSADSVDMTAAQRKQGKYYAPGQLVTTHQRISGLKKAHWMAIEEVDGNCITLKGGRKIDVSKFGHKLAVAEEKTIGVRVGEKLLMQGNDKKAGIVNGTVCTVVSVDKGAVVVENGAGKRIALPEHFRTVTHGYAVTAERSQGATVDHSIVVASNISEDRLYVGASRGRQTLEIYVPERAPLMGRVLNEIRKRELALDYAVAGRPRVRAPVMRRSRGRRVVRIALQNGIGSVRRLAANLRLARAAASHLRNRAVDALEMGAR